MESTEVKIVEIKSAEAEEVEGEVETAVRGQPKSGKFWKTPKEKFRKIRNSMPRKSKDQHLQFRNEMKRVKELSKSIKEERKQVSI